MSKHKIISWDEDKKYSLVSGGLIYRLMSKVKIISRKETGLFRLALIILILTWVPLLILSLIEGTFTGTTVEISFLQDFQIHIKLLIVLPFLILVEKLVDPAYDNYINVTRRIVSEEEEQKFDAVIMKVDKLSNSMIPEIIFLIIIYAVFFLTIDESDLSFTKWSNIDKENFSLAGWYYFLIGFPIYQLLMARWFWRWIIWFYTVIKFSFLKLDIEATHADQTAGLQYLNIVPVTFGFLFLSVAATASATIGMDIINYDGNLQDYAYPIAGFVIAIPLMLFFPLLSFIPALIKARIRAVNLFGSLIQYHNNLYKEKWMEGILPKDENLLGSLDNSSMADINGTYVQSINAMSIIPINLRSIVSIMLLLVLPFLPLILTVYSASEIVTKFTAMIFG